MNKVFIDAHLFDGFGQGTKTYLSGLYASVFKKCPNIDFSMAAHETKGLENEFGSLNNVRYLPYKSKNKFSRLAVDIPRMIKGNGIDAAHFQYVSPLVKTCAEIVTIHDILFLDFPDYFPLSYRLVKSYLFKRSAKRADWVLTVSDYSRDALIRHYKLPAEKIIVTPNGVLDYFIKPEIATQVVAKVPDQPFILYVSRFEPRKNQVGLLRVYCELGLWKRGIQLVFIGTPGVYSREFEQLYGGLGDSVKSNVLFYQDVPVADLKEFYKKSLLFVYPSFAEGFGIPPLEAAVCGANVLCSNATAMGEFVFFGQRLFDPSNAEEFKEKILYYIDNPPSPQERIETKNYIERKYSWSGSADIFISNILKK
ncbi:glycosyltransferase family 1 protein [soil metagenome]